MGTNPLQGRKRLARSAEPGGDGCPGITGSALIAAMCVASILAGCAQPTVVPPTPPAPPPAAAPAPPPTPAPPPAPAPEPPPRKGLVERGRVSLYGAEFAGKPTASGEIFDPDALTMAHRTLPFGTRVRVTNVENQRSVEVIVNDRGPAVAGRIADLSLAAARQIGMVASGVIDAILEIIQPASVGRP
jgi:rare lipoprotein A